MAVDLVRSVWNRKAALSVAESIKNFGPDIAHVHNTWFSLSPSVVEAAHKAVPVVMTVHNYRLTCANALLYRGGSTCEICVTGSAWNGLRLRCYRNAMSSAMAAANVAVHRSRETWSRNVDIFIVLSEFAKTLLTKAGLPSEQMVVQNHAVPDPGPRLVPTTDSDYLLFVGRLSEEKGIDRLLDRWARFGSNDLKLVVCGDGPLRPMVEAAAGIEYRGRLDREDIRRLMLGARALVFPSVSYEGQPLSILEALASGLPVLASRIGAITELLSFLGRPWLVDPIDDEAWLAGFSMVASDMDQLASAEARARFEGHYRPKLVLHQLESTYRRAIGGRS